MFEMDYLFNAIPFYFHLCFLEHIHCNIFFYYMAHGSVHKMARSDWLVTGPYFRVRTREMDPVRWTAPNNLCRKLRSCMSDSGCVPVRSYARFRLIVKCSMELKNMLSIKVEE